MIQELFELPIPTSLVEGKLYYLVLQKAKKTSWIYKGNTNRGHWFRNRGTGADFYVTIESVREIPEEHYGSIMIGPDCMITPEEERVVDLLASYFEITGVKASQVGIVNGYITLEHIEEVVRDYYKENTDYYTPPVNDNPTVVAPPEVPAPITFEEPVKSTPEISLEDARTIASTIPSMAEKMYELYPELRPKVPAIWDLVVSELYEYTANNLGPKKVTPRVKSHVASCEDNVVGIPEYLSTMDAIRRMSILQKFLPELDVDSELYHIILSPETGLVEVVPTADISSPFVFNDETLAGEFLSNNRSTVEMYFDFVQKLFKQQ